MDGLTLDNDDVETMSVYGNGDGNSFGTKDSCSTLDGETDKQNSQKITGISQSN